MVPRFLAVWLLLCTCFLGGCNRPNPGTFSQPEVEAQVMKSLKLTEISLTADPAGGYTGSGKLADGETMKLKITQDPNAKRLSWKAEGDRGTFEDGSYEFE